MKVTEIIPNAKFWAFEYLILKLVEWYKWENKNSKENDLSILKVLKLTFFVSAVGTTKGAKETLLDIFNNYTASPYGHMEFDLLQIIKEKKLNKIKIDNKKTEIYNSVQITKNLDSNIAKKIDESINLLSKINPNLINFSSFELVDLSCSWYSWQKHYTKAKEEKRKSYPIPIEFIKAEHKIYQL